MHEDQGHLDILNCGAGHLSFTFKKDDREEVAKAKRVIQDMLRRGYAIFVDQDGELKRVKRFNHDKEEYIIEEHDAAQPSKPNKRKGVPIRKAKATAIPRTGGG